MFSTITPYYVVHILAEESYAKNQYFASYVKKSEKKMVFCDILGKIGDKGAR